MADRQPQVYIRVTALVVACVVTCLPVFGIVFSVVWSLMYDFERATHTHCKVPNYLPSISAAIGGFTPQRYIWRTCIGLHSAPRFMVAIAYYNFHMSLELAQHSKTYGIIAAVACFLHIIENAALLGLTYVASNENHGVHEKFFIMFLVSSLLYMLLTLILIKWGRTYHGRVMTSSEKYSLKIKFILFIFNITCCIMAAYTFWRHNAYCEPGAYTTFAISEYGIVTSNIMFHFLWMGYDMRNTEWIVLGYRVRLKPYDALV